MTRRGSIGRVAWMVTAAAVLAACSQPAEPATPQEQAADLLIEALTLSAEDDAVRVTVDQDCVRSEASGLSDSDAEAIVAASRGEDLVIGEAAEATALSLFDCLTIVDRSSNP